MAGIVQSPLAIATWVLVIFEVASLTLAMTGQYPAWTVGRSNLEALAGKTCGLAEDVMVEQDPNAGMLTPVECIGGRRPGRRDRRRLHAQRYSRRRLAPTQ